MDSVAPRILRLEQQLENQAAQIQQGGGFGDGFDEPRLQAGRDPGMPRLILERRARSRLGGPAQARRDPGMPRLNLMPDLDGKRMIPIKRKGTTP